MTTQLTLNIEENVISVAQEYAKEKGQSLSEMVENYLKNVTVGKGVNKRRLSPNVEKLRGIIKIDEGLDYKDILTEELSKKYKKNSRL